MKKTTSAEIIADSVNPQGNRLTTYILEVPQIIVKELLRHRMFSFSSSSMRAIPFNKVLRNIREDMFVPLAFQSHHSGMQGSEYLTESDAEQAKAQWIETGLKACEEADRLYKIGVTKQLCSRIIEPYGYAKILVTATHYNNFFNLRCPKYIVHGKNTVNIETFKSKKDALEWVNDVESPFWNYTELDWVKNSQSQAEIHIQALAEAMWDAKNESKPKELRPGDWHIPFGNKMDKQEIDKFAWITNKKRNLSPIQTEIAIATSRCARLSYMTFDGEIDYEADIKLHDRLLESRHASPFEHVARAVTDEEYYSHVKGKIPAEHDRYGIINHEYYPLCTNNTEAFFDMPLGPNKNNGDRFGWFDNFKGFQSYRHILENK